MRRYEYACVKVYHTSIETHLRMACIAMGRLLCVMSTLNTAYKDHLFAMSDLCSVQTYLDLNKKIGRGQNAVTAHFTSKQLLPFGSARQS